MRGKNRMKIDTRNLGVVEYKEEKVIVFQEGIPGFEELTRFILLEDKEIEGFLYLQSVEDKNICFVMTDPYNLKLDYTPSINESYFEKLGGGADEDFALYAIACIKEVIQESTINLAGPILIHTKNMKGIQVITEDKVYQTKHRMIDLLEERG